MEFYRRDTNRFPGDSLSQGLWYLIRFVCARSLHTISLMEDLAVRRDNQARIDQGVSVLEQEGGETQLRTVIP